MSKKEEYKVNDSLYGVSFPELTPSDVPDNNFCWHRLPCGICRLTNQQCPKLNNSQPYGTLTNTLNNTTGDAPKPDLENYSISVCKK